MREPINVMVIDDDVAIGEVLRINLKRIFANVDFYNCPTEALSAAKDLNYGLILSDINMPKMLGPELIEILRANGNLAPVIFVSGHITKENASSALRLGVSDIIPKPFDKEILVQTILRVLEIEKRKIELIINGFNKEVSKEVLDQKRKILGLLQVVNDRKKTG